MNNQELRKRYRAAAIAAIEARHGTYFRMALSHLLDVGYRHITPESVEETKVSILNEEPDAQGKPVMTPEFQCHLLDIALELKQFSLWELLSYVKTDLHVG